MRAFIPSSVALLLILTGSLASALDGDFTGVNPRIDFTAFLSDAKAADEVRNHHRLSEARFIELSKQPGVVILDARSRDKFEMLHVAGAINLPYADISEPSLAKTLPDKSRSSSSTATTTLNMHRSHSNPKLCPHR